MKRHIRKAFAICVAMVLLFAMAVPALGVSWYLATYPANHNMSTTVAATYHGGDRMDCFCDSFSISVGTANIKITAPSYTYHIGYFSPNDVQDDIRLQKTEVVKERASVAITCSVVNMTNPSTATTSAEGNVFLIF